MSQYNLIAATTESTVVAEYTPETRRSESYQSEAALEREFIRMLTAQGYEYLTIHDEAALIANLRRQLEKLNHYTFTDAEGERFVKACLARANEGSMERPCAGAAAGQRRVQKHLPARQEEHSQ